METLCACGFPHAVNQCDGRYHCDHCGYPLAPDDHRVEYLSRIGLEHWCAVAWYARALYDNPEAAWRYATARATATMISPRPVFVRVRLSRAPQFFSSSTWTGRYEA